ncbi:MAG: two-component sensor histidine kinase [Geodermatophilaceae bacterium]|nr:two-component sensor histidine kinase [Geodermatophilaceae bacterium]
MSEHDGSVSDDSRSVPGNSVPVGEDPNDRSTGRSSILLGLIAFGLLALAILGVAVAIGISIAVGLDIGDAVDSFVVTNSVMGLAFPIAGVLIAWYRPRNPIGWLLLFQGIAHATTAAMAPVYEFGVAHHWSQPLLRTVLTFYAYAWPWSIGLCLPLVLLLFPDGHLPGRGWRWLVGIIGANSVLFTVSVGGEPATFAVGNEPWLVVPNHEHLAGLWTFSEVLNLMVLGAALVALGIRYRRGDEQRRRQLLWLALAAGLVFVVLIPWGLFAAGPVLILLAIPLIPAAIAVAILRHQLLDIRLVVSRTVLYAVLTAVVIGAYLGLVAVADTVLRAEVGVGTSVLATVLIAVAFNPLRIRLQGLVDRAIYGDRRDPVRAASRVGAQLSTAGSGLEGVPAVLCQALHLPFAALRDGAGELAAYGTAPETLHTVPLDYGGERTGELVFGARPGERRLDPADRAAVELLAVPLAVALRATTLSQAVQQSREQLVSAREEERRRLRRDLHDGLGPTLTGVAFQADAARNLLTDDPEQARQLLEALRGQTTAAIDEIRRLVYGLRPPALDELGLVGTLRREADRLAPLQIEIDAPDPLPPLPAAVEVAAYRIATEALNNVARHAHARRVTLMLRCAADLQVAVIDDGASNGHGAVWSAGVGLTSMAERAGELGGSCAAGPRPGGGGSVRAVLPLGGAR